MCLWLIILLTVTPAIFSLKIGLHQTTNPFKRLHLSSHLGLHQTTNPFKRLHLSARVGRIERWRTKSNKATIPLLPFGFDEVVMLGEEKQLRLYEERFQLLFKEVMENYNGVVAMGYFSQDNNLIQTCSICEVLSFNSKMLEGSILVNMRCVSKGSLKTLVKASPFPVVALDEEHEILPNNAEFCELLADSIEMNYKNCAATERQLRDAREAMKETVAPIPDFDYDSDSNPDSSMLDRIAAAEKALLNDDGDGYGDGYGDGDDFDNGDIPTLKEDIMVIVETAKIPFTSMTLNLNTTNFESFNQTLSKKWTRDELHALSYCAFQNSGPVDKIFAMSTNSLFERLKFADKTLKEKLKLSLARISLEKLE